MEKKADRTKVQKLKMSLGQRTNECEALENKRLEKDGANLELSIAKKEQSLTTQRSGHEKQVQEMNKLREADQKKKREALQNESRILERERDELQNFIMFLFSHA